MELDELPEKIKELLRTFPLLGFTGKQTFRCVDEDVFLDGLKQILAQVTDHTGEEMGL